MAFSFRDAAAFYKRMILWLLVNSKQPSEKDADELLQNKMFRLKPEAIRAFDILKAEQGARSGPRLIAEAIDLLLVKYGKKKIGFP